MSPERSGRRRPRGSIRRSIRWLGLLLPIVQAIPAQADRSHPLEELFVGQVVFLQEPLELQTTLSTAWTRTPSGHVLTIGPLLELGLTDRLQLEADVPLRVVSTGAGGSSGEGTGETMARLGLKYGFASEPGGVRLAAGFELGLPDFSGADEVETEAFAVAYRSIGRAHFNLAGSIELAPLALRDEGVGFSAAYSLFFTLGPVLPVLEAGWSYRDGASYVVAPGLVFMTPLHLEVGLSLPVGISDAGLAYGAVLLVTYELELGEADR